MVADSCYMLYYPSVMVVLDSLNFPLLPPFDLHVTVVSSGLVTSIYMISLYLGIFHLRILDF